MSVHDGLQFGGSDHWQVRAQRWQFYGRWQLTDGSHRCPLRLLRRHPHPSIGIFPLHPMFIVNWSFDLIAYG